MANRVAGDCTELGPAEKGTLFLDRGALWAALPERMRQTFGWPTRNVEFPPRPSLPRSEHSTPPRGLGWEGKVRAKPTDASEVGVREARSMIQGEGEKRPSPWCPRNSPWALGGRTEDGGYGS
jgi:hypothetical protein